MNISDLSTILSEGDWQTDDVAGIVSILTDGLFTAELSADFLIDFIDFNVVKTIENYHYLTWDVKPALFASPISVDEYVFHILYSRDPATGFTELPGVEIDGAVGPLSYTHTEIQYDFNQYHYYKIKAISKIITTDIEHSNMEYIGSRFDGHHETIRYAESLLYDHYAGEPTYVMKKKVTGSRCTSCWSESRQQRIKTTCSTCNGSGFVDGYFTPIQVQILYTANPKKDDVRETTEDMTNELVARMSNYPLVRPKDLIINKDTYKRYMITQVKTTKIPQLRASREVFSKQNYVLSQILNLKEINPSDPEYSILLT